MSYQCTISTEKGKCSTESFGISISHRESVALKAQDAPQPSSSRMQLFVAVPTLMDIWRINSDSSRIREQPPGLAGEQGVAIWWDTASFCVDHCQETKMKRNYDCCL